MIVFVYSVMCQSPVNWVNYIWVGCRFHTIFSLLLLMLTHIKQHCWLIPFFPNLLPVTLDSIFYLTAEAFHLRAQWHCKSASLEPRLLHVKTNLFCRLRGQSTSAPAIRFYRRCYVSWKCHKALFCQWTVGIKASTSWHWDVEPGRHLMEHRAVSLVSTCQQGHSEQRQTGGRTGWREGGLRGDGAWQGGGTVCCQIVTHTPSRLWSPT